MNSTEFFKNIIRASRQGFGASSLTYRPLRTCPSKISHNRNIHSHHGVSSHLPRRLQPAVRQCGDSVAGITVENVCSRAGQLRTHSTVNTDQDAQTEWRRRIVGAQPYQNLKVGPYKRGKWFVSYKDDPGSFITNILIILVTGYSIFTMMPGESMKVRRQRKLRQVLLDNAQMTEADLIYIENYKLPEEAQHD